MKQDFCFPFTHIASLENVILEESFDLSLYFGKCSAKELEDILSV